MKDNGKQEKNMVLEFYILPKTNIIKAPFRMD